MAASSTIINQEIRDRVPPIREDTDNWGDDELARRWNRGVAYVQARLAGFISLSDLETFDSDAGITNLFKILYGGMAAAYTWLDIHGDQETKQNNYAALKSEIDDLIDQIITGRMAVYDVDGEQIAISGTGEDDFYYTQENTEPVFRRGRYDEDGNLLDSEEGSLDAW